MRCIILISNVNIAHIYIYIYIYIYGQFGIIRHDKKSENSKFRWYLNETQEFFRQIGPPQVRIYVEAGFVYVAMVKVLQDEQLP